MVHPASRLPLSIASQRTRFSPVYALLEQAVADQVFPGCGFGMLAETANGLEVVALDAVGRQTYAEDAPRIAPASVYDLASVTKVMATTAMAMLLYERGLLLLDRPVAAILPPFNVVGDLDRARVTLRHLLAHASGLPGYARLFETERTPEALLHACLSMPLQHPPGVHSEYSDLGFILLGKALETISGESIDTFCRREVFTICGMDNTCFLPDASLRPHIPPTEKDMTFRHRVIQGEVQDENCFVLGGVSGHAGLFGNALDVLRFAAALLDSADGAHKNSLFQRETVSLFSARVALPPGSSRALGWDTPSASSYSETSSSGTLFSAHSIGHLGYAGTSLWIDLDARIAITLLSNRTWPDRQNQAIRTLRPRFHDMICTALQSH